MNLINNSFFIYNKIQGQVSPERWDGLRCLSPFSVTRSHSVPRHYTSCRGVSPTSQRVCITSRSCTKSQLGNWPTCIRPDLNPGLLLGRRLCYHYTRATIHDGQEIKLEDLIRRAAQTSILASHCMLASQSNDLEVTRVDVVNQKIKSSFKTKQLIRKTVEKRS